jgi:hypothetical protein
MAVYNIFLESSTKKEDMMRKTSRQTMHKLLAFYQDPLNRKLIATETSNSSRLWHHIFLHFFLCGPKDPQGKNVTRYKVPGSNDPRWDELLQKNKALYAQHVVLRYLRRQEKKNVATERKAA